MLINILVWRCCSKMLDQKVGVDYGSDDKFFYLFFESFFFLCLREVVWCLGLLKLPLLKEEDSLSDLVFVTTRFSAKKHELKTFFIWTFLVWFEICKKNNPPKYSNFIAKQCW